MEGMKVEWTIAMLICMSTVACGSQPYPLETASQMASAEEIFRELAQQGDCPGDIRESSLYLDLVQSGTKDDFLRLVKQTDYPMVAIAGFMAMREKYPGHSFEAALWLFCSMENPVVFVAAAGALSVIEQAEDTDCNRITLYDITQSVAIEDDATLAVLIMKCVDASLVNGLVEQYGIRISQPWAAVALDRIYPMEGETPTPTMVQVLELCKQHEGFPMSVYLHYHEEIDAEYTRLLQDFLSDPDTDSLYVLVLLHGRHEDFSDSQVLERIILPQDRREEIEGYLSDLEGNGCQ